MVNSEYLTDLLRPNQKSSQAVRSGTVNGSSTQQQKNALLIDRDISSRQNPNTLAE